MMDEIEAVKYFADTENTSELNQEKRLKNLIRKTYPMCNADEVNKISEIIWGACQRELGNGLKGINIYVIKKGARGK